MSYHRGISELFRGDSTDITIAKLGLIVCLLLLSLRLVAQQALFVVIPGAGASACALYLVTRRREAQSTELTSRGGRLVGYAPGLVFLGLAALVATIRLTGGRSLSTHILTGAIGTCLLAQLALAGRQHIDTRLVLLQLGVAALVIRFSALFATPGYIGVDIWTHIPVFVGGIVEAGSLAPIADTKYVMAPIYHLNGAVAALVFGSPRAGTFLALGTVVALSFLFIYTASRLLVPARWALFAGTLFVFSDQVFRWSVHIIPTSLGLVYFLAMLYCLTKLYYETDIRLLWLVLVTTLAVVFTHQVSTAIVLLVLAVATVVSIGTALRRSSTVPTDHRIRALGLSGVLVTSVGITLVSWANTPFSGDFVFLWRMLDVLSETVTSDAGFLALSDGGGAGGSVSTSGGSVLAPIVEWFGFGVLLAVTVIGAIVLTRRVESAELKHTYAISVAVIFFAVFGLSLFGIRTLLPGRWIAFMYAPMVVLGAIGLQYVSRNASPRVLMAVVLVVAAGYPVAMMSAEKATLDAPTFDEENPRFAYTEAEIGAVATISEYRSPAVDEAIGTDHPYRTLYGRTGGFATPDLVVEDGQAVQPSTTVARDYQVSGPTTVYAAGDPPVPAQSNELLSGSLCTTEQNQLYTNEDVALCVPATGGTS